MKKLNKGMFKDTALVDQPEGTMRDALNANLNDKKGSISNEWGTYNYPQNMNFLVIGREVLDDDRIVMFGQQVDEYIDENNNVLPAFTDQIRILNTRTQDVTILYENPGLNFQQTHPIVTTSRKNQAGEYLVYFTDGFENEGEIYEGFDYVTEYNPPRVINITKQIAWRFGGGPVNTLYNPTNTFYKLQLIPRVGIHARFASAVILEGGNLPCAAYYLALAYADQDGLETNYFVVSNPVYIAPGPENTLPTNSFIGAEGGTPTSKSIRWVVQTPAGIDYQLLQPAVMKLQKTALTAVKLPPVQIQRGANTEVTYTGSEDVADIATEDIVVDNVNYITADTINQLDNRLYLGNVATNKDIGFQAFAHNINLTTVLDPVENFNPRLYDTFILNHGYSKLVQTYHNEIGQQFDRQYAYDSLVGYVPSSPAIVNEDYIDVLRYFATEDFDNSTTRKGYRNPAYSFFRKSYRRGEVYAFYISFVLNDGSETYAYHIPGRLPECVDWESTIDGPIQYLQTSGFRYFSFEYTLGFGSPQELDIIFYELGTAFTADGVTYNAGWYFIGFWNGQASAQNSVPSLNNFTNGTCPDVTTVSLENSLYVLPADDEDPLYSVAQYVGTADVNGGGTWPYGNFNGNNILTFMNNFPNVLTGKTFTGNYTEQYVECPINILNSAYSSGDNTSSGNMCENDSMAQTPYDGTRAAFGFRPEEMLEQNNDLDVYQLLDTSRQTENSTGYWENSNEFYPNTRDFLMAQVLPNGTTAVDPAVTMAGGNVRHHRMPSNLGDSSFIEREDQVANTYTEQARRAYLRGRLQTTERADDNGSFVTVENINILGVQLNNLRIPREMLGQIQGYKIYYAKREQKDKTILGQSLAIPGHPRYGTSGEQSLEEAITGPFHKAFYMYGGLDHTDGSTVMTYGKWKGNEYSTVGANAAGGLRPQQFYYAHPVFKFHDFNMLRKRVDLTAATHIQCQYGVMFRTYQGGPGVFVKPCDYDKIWDVPINYDMDNFDNGTNSNYLVFNYQRQSSLFEQYYWFGIFDDDLRPWEAHATSFPSIGWVSPEMRNTVDFYWHDIRLTTGNNNDEEDDLTGSRRLNKAFVGETQVLDLTDGYEGDYSTVFGDGDTLLDFGNEFETTPKKEDSSLTGAKRARRWRKGEDLTQPAENKKLSKVERYLAIKAKEARIRAWFTSAMIGTTYVSPTVTVSSIHIIKAGDRKIPQTTNGLMLNRWYQEGNFDDNQFILAIEPAGKILLHGKDNHNVKSASAFKGAKRLYNRSGETSHAFSLVSGLPGLRGHAPFYPNNPDNPNQATIWTTGARPQLVRWGDSNKFLYPDAARDGIPWVWQLFGDNNNPAGYYQTGNIIDGDPYLYDPSGYRGLRYNLTEGDAFDGRPMAWLVNVCATRTDVFNPFDRQNLVWTGYYQPILDVNLDTGEAVDESGIVSNYYTGAQSDPVFGGDTYISKYSFRTTSQSYGHAYFRANKFLGDPKANAIGNDPLNDPGLADWLNNVAISTVSRGAAQLDIPTNLNPFDFNKNGNVPFGMDRFGTTSTQPIWNWASGVALSNGDYEDDSGYDVALKTLDILQDSRNWVKGNVNPVSTVYTFMCETDDLVEFRHVDDEEQGENTKFFDYNTAHSTIFNPPIDDLTHPDKLLYGDHYSALQDKKVTSPLPVYGELSKVQTFPNRVVRSDVDSGSLADGYRKFRALEFKDIPAHRGVIKNLFSLNGNLYIHTDRSLFVTKGKEELQLDAVTAFIGSGNIFVQDPDEAMQADAGHAGTASRHAHVTTAYGHFYVNYRDRKVYNVGPQGIQDVTNGMESWLRENMPFVVEQFGINLDSPQARANGFYIDATTGPYVPIGFTLGYDPLWKRVLITKHEPVPTPLFFEQFYSGSIVVANSIPFLVDNENNDCLDPETYSDPSSIADPRGKSQSFKPEGQVWCGPIWFGNPRYFTQRTWTVSYYPEMQVWGSRHSYGPNLYTNTSEYLVSFAQGIDVETGDEFYGTWEHSNELNPGRFYGQVYNFEVEYIDNTGAGEAKLFSNIFYWAESFLPNQNSISEQFRVSNPVFDQFYAYNSTQITGLPITINYLNNARLVDRIWYINDIRDLAVQQEVIAGELITGTVNVAGNITTSVTTHPQAVAMFTEEGVVNNNYVNINKEWYNRRKLVDHFMGVRLIKDNTNRNLVHLYAAGTKFRKAFR